MCTLVAVGSTLEGGLWDASNAASQAVAARLGAGLSPATAGVVLAAGLATSLSPCTLSVLPLTIGYIAGYGDRGASSDEGSKPRVGLQALCFSLGLASSLAGLGVVSSRLGRAYGQTPLGPALPVTVALVAIAAGLNLLEVVRIPLPSLQLDVRSAGLPAPLTAYLAGATFALAASPCSTPVLASLLAFAATSETPGAGGLLLLCYSCGYVAPLLAAASATGAAKQMLSLRAYSSWVTPASGMLLVAGGTYALLSRLAPA